MKMVTVIAPVNIAVIKYWGKRDEELILPINDSISGTLSTEFMCAKTTIQASPLFKENKFWLNGKEQTFDNPRLDNCLKEVKKRADSNSPILKWKIAICSENNFPTAAGLASSAAGYACLVLALTKLYDIQSDISSIARRGSGSACRSIYGGWIIKFLEAFDPQTEKALLRGIGRRGRQMDALKVHSANQVQWIKGESPTGEDSIAVQLAPAAHWPEMRVVILVVNDERKKYSSTSGMKRSVETSELLRYRADKIVPKRIEAMKEAILKKDFGRFARITMEDSNQFHAICLDTFPPCVYMNDTSHAIVDVIHAYNESKSSIKVAYTFDAGPNACLYVLDSDVDELLCVINYVFPPGDTNTVEYFKGHEVNQMPISRELKAVFEPMRQKEGSLKYIIHTKIGNGPNVLQGDQNSLLTDVGLPKNL